MLSLSACAVDPGSTRPDVLDPTVRYAADTVTGAPTSGRYSTYIALGDSFSSANGVENEGPVCMRGDGAWPHLLNPKLPLQDPSQLAVLEACSGATTVGILGVEQGMPPQINKVTSIAPATLASALITITIGGNDIDVSGELRNCLQTNCTKKEASILAKIDQIRMKLFNTYDALRKAAPKATIVAVGYPHLVAATATTSCTDDPTAEIELAERAMIRRTIDAMNETIKAAAADAKIYAIVDEIVAAFEGREACAGTGADLIHKVEDAALLFGVFHQNAAGNEAYSEAVLRGLSARVPSVSTVAQPQPASAPTTTSGMAATPGSTPTTPATPVRTTTPTPVPASTANPKPTSTAKPAGSASTPGSTADESDTETDSDSEADSDEDSVDADGEEDDTQDEDASASEEDMQAEDGSSSEDDTQDEDDSGSEDDVRDEDG
jgi:lysophospholipase L1-like esterase